MSVLLTDVLTTDDAAQLVEQQRDRLLVRLGGQREQAAVLWEWYHGRQPDAVVPGRYRDQYRLLMSIAKTPWARLVVDTIAERLHVLGFTGTGVTDEEDAWRLFNASQMNADEWLVYTEALITGEGYLSVSATPDDGVSIAPESAFEVTHEPVPGNRRTVAAALKLYPLDWTARVWAVELYRPEATYRWATEVDRPLIADDGSLMPFPLNTQPELRDAVEWVDVSTTPNALNIVPVIPFENRATVLGGGVSELGDCVPILRRIDKLTLDKLLTSELGSFRQKWATGLEIPTDESGNPVEPYKAAVDRLWIAPGEAGKDVKFGTFDLTELDPYIKAIDAEIAALAAISRVPAHYLMQQNLANPPSAESLIASESGLVAKVQERQRRFGEAWERTLRIALALERSSTVQAIGELQVTWQDAEMRNPAQVADAAVKLSTIGVPQRALWEYIGATPEQIAEWETQAVSEQLTAAAMAPPAPPPAPAGG